MDHKRIARFAFVFVAFALLACAQGANDVVGNKLTQIANDAANVWSLALGTLGLVLGVAHGAHSGHGMKGSVAEGVVAGVLMMNAPTIVRYLRFG